MSCITAVMGINERAAGPALVFPESGEGSGNSQEIGTRDWELMKTKPSKYLGVRVMSPAHATSLPGPQILIPATLKVRLKYP